MQIYGGWIWEGNSLETKPEGTEGAKDGHIFKELDTGDTYSRVSGVWEFSSSGLSYIRATKSGRVTTDSSGFSHVTFNNPIINDQYTVTLTCITAETNILAYSTNVTTDGFDIYTKVVPVTPQYNMFIDTSSDIATYKQMVLLQSYPSGSVARKTTNLSVTPTLMQVFATNAGFPGASLLPRGKFVSTLQTEKAAGSNNYIIYFELWKMTSGGSETLLATSNLSNQTPTNLITNHELAAFLNADLVLLTTDRIVVKIYGQMISATANVDLIFDGTTNVRLELFRESYIKGGILVSWLATRDYNP